MDLVKLPTRMRLIRGVARDFAHRRLLIQTTVLPLLVWAAGFAAVGPTDVLFTFRGLFE